MLNKKIAVCFFLLFITNLFAAEITGYQVVNSPFITPENRLLIAIRSFKMDNRATFLVVDPFSFATSLYNKKLVKKSACFPTYLLRLTPFGQMVQKNSSPPFLLQNHGLKKSIQPVKGYLLTVDLCPSRAPFDKAFFYGLLKFSSGEGPIPVALCVSGLWLKKHLTEFNWLLKLQSDKKIAITWVNHSWSHPYFRSKPLRENFLLAQGVSFDLEVLDVEKFLLKKGQLPSVFFRFPGLVSNRRLILKLKNKSLLPLGSGSWMAKDEIPFLGSIVLVHGNGNEPEGLVKLFHFLEKKRELFKKGELRFLPLNLLF